jgi:hypothetical protein
MHISLKHSQSCWRKLVFSLRTDKSKQKQTFQPIHRNTTIENEQRNGVLLEPRLRGITFVLSADAALYCNSALNNISQSISYWIRRLLVYEWTLEFSNELCFITRGEPKRDNYLEQFVYYCVYLLSRVCPLPWKRVLASRCLAMDVLLLFTE